MKISNDLIFIDHIKSHLKEGEEVICKICGKSANEIITQQGKKKIRLNREKTVKFIGNLFGRVFEQDKYAIVDAFEAKLEGLLEVVE